MKSLMKEQPMTVLPELAVRIGLNEAIFIQELQNLLESSNQVHEGNHWVYKSYESWSAHFPFWSLSTLRRTIARL